jgi:putative nucleotidyltransferase with HDIG domain
MDKAMSQELETTRSKTKKIELIIHQLDSLPTLPAVAARLLQITVQSDTQAAEVVRLIESDPSLASRLIALTTQAGRGVRRQTATVSKAVVLLGFEAVRNAVLSIKVFEAFNDPASDRKGYFDREGFWKHSLAVACAAQMLISSIDRKIDPEEAFVCGLLHDMGKVALDAALPKSFDRVVQLTESSLGNISQVEQRVLGMDHTVAGKRLAEKWSLPESIMEVVWLHHQQVQTLPDSLKHRSLVQAVHLADILARQQRIGYSGNHIFPESALQVAEQLGCPESVLEKTARALPDKISERAEILGLEAINSEQLYYEALGEANQQLGKLNLRLQQQNRILQRRSIYFDLLSELIAGLRPGLSVVEVCSRIADLWQRHLRCGHCAVYAGGGDELIIEGAIKQKTEAQASVFLVDRTEDPDVSAEAGQTGIAGEFAGQTGVLPVGSTHQWFFEQVASMFDIRTTLMLPLRQGQELVGGLLWQGDMAHLENYQSELKELRAFSHCAAWAIRQTAKLAEQSRVSEELARTSRLLHETQTKLIQKRSMAAVGEMACGAAHEINNPLAVVVGRSELLASSEADAEKKATLQAISKCGREITAIVTELMEFAQPALPRPSALPVAGLISNATDLRAHQAQQENVQFDVELADNLPDVSVDGNQVTQALGELLANAIESYQGAGGSVRIRGNLTELEDEVILEVVDQGCGMNEETLLKAFDPFYSLKQAGRKRGLGLSRSRRYLEENGGHVHLSSEPGQGTTARVVLPVASTNGDNKLNHQVNNQPPM